MKSQFKCNFFGGKTKDSRSINNPFISKGYVYACNRNLRYKKVSDNLTAFSVILS